MRDMKDATTALRSFSNRTGSFRSQLAVGIGIKYSSAAHLKGELGSVIPARLIPCDGVVPIGYTAVRWPIPESYWVDSTVEKFPSRDSFPALTICRHAPSVAENSSGVADISGSPDYFLNLARELRLHLETFELAPTPGAPMSVLKSLGVNSQEKYHVYVQGSGKPTTLDSTASIGSLMLTSQANVTANAINGSSHAVPPFAILLASSTSKTRGSCELKILPFNYPIILPLLQKALEIKKKCQTQQKLLQHPWYSQCQTELYAYLHTVPSYAYPPVIEMLGHMGLKSLIAQRVIGKQMEDKIHKVPFKQIQLMKGIAIAGAYFLLSSASFYCSLPLHQCRSSLTLDPYFVVVEITSLQAAARRKWHCFVRSPIEVAMASCEPGRRRNLPQSISKVCPCDMLSVYESMRGLIFGGGKGWTASQLGVRGTHHRNDWLLNAIGGSADCQHSVMEMGNFYDVLARKEALRDPLLIDTHPPDEDTPEGLLNRKTEVNLGNRFKGGKNVGGMSLGGVEIETNTGVRIVCREEATKLNSTVDSTSSADLFMDTPFPAIEDGGSMEDFCYSPITDRDDFSADFSDTQSNVEDTITVDSSKNRSEHYSIISNDYQEMFASATDVQMVVTLPPMGKPYSVLNCKRKRDSEERVTATIQQSLRHAGPIIKEWDRVDADMKRSGEDDMAINSIGCVVQDSIQHKTDAGEDQSNMLPAIIHIKESPLVHVPSEVQLPSTCWVKKFSERIQKDYWFNVSDGRSVWEMPSSNF